jgi:hypothetical protein
VRRHRIVVIGGGAGSAAAVAELRKQGFDGSLTLVSAENTVPYERPPLSKGFLLGTSGQVPVKDAAWYEQAAVELILGSRATRLDLAARTSPCPAARSSATTSCCSPPGSGRASCPASTATASATCGPARTPPRCATG